MSPWYLCAVLLAALAGCAGTQATAEGSAESAAQSGQAAPPSYVGRPETARSRGILLRVKGSEDNQAATRR